MGGLALQTICPGAHTETSDEGNDICVIAKQIRRILCLDTKLRLLMTSV